MFPATTQQFNFGHQTIKLQLPVETAVQEWYKAQDQETPFPFWARIWPSAKALTQFLSTSKHLYENKSVVEFGAGIGLPALFSASAAASVLITDHASDAMDWFTQHHASLHKHVGHQHFDWAKNQIWPEADCVLMSDVNYRDGDFKDLMRLIQHYSAVKATIILATPQRIIARDFVQIIAPYVKAEKTIEIDEHQISVYVLG